MPLSDAEKFLTELDAVLTPLPASNRELMKAWAAREMVMAPVITKTTAKVWVDEYTEEGGKKRPAGYHTLEWRMAAASPQNPEAVIFAMMQVDGDHVHVFSFAPVKLEGSDETGFLYFKEILYHPETTFGPMSGEALFEEFKRYLATEEEREELAEAEDKAAEAAAKAQPRANGGAS